MMRSILHRTHRDGNFATLNNTAVEDPKLNGLAKALHHYAFSRPEDWELRIGDLRKRFKEGREALTAAFKNLEMQGYLRRTTEHAATGKFATMRYEWFEQPLPIEERIIFQVDRRRLKKSSPRTRKP
jgi:hypothetical protein